MKNPMYLGVFSTDDPVADLRQAETEWAGEDLDSCQEEDDRCDVCGAILATSTDDHGKEELWCPRCGEA